jgi:hypothetical protein
MTTKKPAPKKPARKKPSAQKLAPKKAAAKQAAVKKATTKKPPAERWATRADKGAPVVGYVAKLKGDQRAIADALISIIGQAVPNATSGLKWGMPVWEVGGKVLTYFRAQKHDVRFGLNFAGVVDLPDPDGRLEGTSSDGKHVKLTSPSQIDPALFARWLEVAAATHI